MQSAFTYVLNLSRRRLIRTSHLYFGYPYKAINLINKSAVVQLSIREHMRDTYEAWVAWQAYGNKGAFARACLKRHVLNDPLTVNLFRFQRDVMWVNASPVAEEMCCAMSGAVLSKVCEDGAHFLRSMETRDQCNTMATCNRAWHNLHKKRILFQGDRHGECARASS